MKWNSELNKKLINSLMIKGEKSKAQKLLKKCLNYLKTNRLNAHKVIHKAIENAKPNLQIKPTRRKGKTFQIPKVIKPKKQYEKAIKWIILEAKKNLNQKEKEGTMAIQLTKQLLLAAKFKGPVIKKKFELYRLAQANRSYMYMR